MRRWFGRFTFGLVGLYAAATWAGWDVGASRSGFVVPKNVRSSPGGYRSYTYWRGGK